MMGMRTCLILIILLLGACRPSSPNLAGEWKLNELNGDVLISETSITLVFEDQKVSGSGGCNSYSGEYSIKNGKISFTNLTMTLMACLDEQVTDQEASYFNALNQVDSFELSQDDLLLTGSDVSLKFEKIVP